MSTVLSQHTEKKTNEYQKRQNRGIFLAESWH